jgi:hypothetical protein
MRLADVATHLAVTKLMQQLHDVAPRDLATVSRNLAQVRQVLINTGNKLDFTSIELTLIGADGEPISLEETPAAKP